MLKRIFVAFVILFVLLLASGTMLLTSSQFSTVVNIFLPKEWQMSVEKGGFQLQQEGASLPQFTLRYQACSLATVDDMQLNWGIPKKLTAERVSLDYACLLNMPTSETKQETFSLNPILALLPESEVIVKSLVWKNVPEDLNPRLKQLLNESTQLNVIYKQNVLAAKVMQQAVQFDGKFTNNQLSGNLFYQPSGEEKHNLLFSTQLDDNLLAMPKQFEGDYHWQLPKALISNEELRAGSVLLNWTPNEENALVGTLVFTSEKQPKNTLKLPFKFDFNALDIYQGKFNWEWLKDFPINGSTTAIITPKNLIKGEIFPIQTQFRANFFSHDKHTLSIATTKGVIKSPHEFDLPFTLSGYVKYNSFRLFSQATIQANEKGMQFSPKSMFHIISGKERLLTIKELTIPLGNIRFDRYGVTGRFQASFKGETPDFQDIDLHLDGSANHFKMGLLNFFDNYAGKPHQQDLWQWRLSGNAHLKALNSKIALDGKGQWHSNLVQIDQLNGKMAQVKHKSIFIPQAELRLTSPVKFAYEKWHLMGGAEIVSPEIQFNYGGKLLRPSTKLNFDGEIEKLRFDGKIQAGKVGPIELSAQRHLDEKSSRSSFQGQLRWDRQSADVFQPLIPPRYNWVIKAGTVSGYTDFHTLATEAGGLVASGRISIKNGGLSLPNGEINGVEFTLPYALDRGQFKFGEKQPIAVTIAEMKQGLPIYDIHLNIDGYYPYSASKPLNLSKLTMQLLGGNLMVERLSLPQRDPAYLKLENIDLEQIMSLMQYQQIDLKGRASAVLPFWLDGEPCYICDGLLTQSATSNLKISPELMAAISKSSGYSERILLYLLNDTRINDLRSLINVGKQGDMVLDAKLKLQLNQQEKAKVNFNYNHKENIFHLWHLINAGSYVEQGIENNLYQKLDNKK